MSPVRTRSQEALAQAAEEAELLATAQAQARAEDEIQGRLPWEVLNINKRLDRQQQSVDEIQGNISKLTDMVSQLSKSWNSTESSRSGHGTVLIPTVSDSVLHHIILISARF
jgi:peptidoglycan hydrolase CwlO-like protein